ncbi:Hypothetical protein AT6N2_L0015 [Agrobacterium tumefaciens]|nr:Hypothetical protein AT6N2_L0015 [Agrobacterium tumefaciens]
MSSDLFQLFDVLTADRVDEIVEDGRSGGQPGQSLLGDFVMIGVASLHIGFVQRIEPRLKPMIIPRPGLGKADILPFSQPTQKLQIMARRTVVGESQKQRGIGLFYGLMQHESCLFPITISQPVQDVLDEEFSSARASRKMLFGNLICLLHRKAFGLGELSVIQLVQRNAITPDIVEEILPFLQKIADFASAMHDKPHGRLDLLVPHQPVCRLVPVFGIGQFLVADDDEDVEIRAIAFRRMRLIHPGATRVRTEQNDFENTAILLGVRLGALHQISKLFLNNSDDARELALLSFRQMFKAGLHVCSVSGRYPVWAIVNFFETPIFGSCQSNACARYCLSRPACNISFHSFGSLWSLSLLRRAISPRLSPSPD